MYFNDDYPFGNNPFSDSKPGYWLFGEFIEEEEEDQYDPDDYPDDDDLPSASLITPRPSGELDDLPF